MVSHSHAIYYIDKFYHQKLMHCDALGWYWGRRSRLLILFNLTVFSLNPLKEREKRDLCRFNLPSLNTKVIATRKLKCWKCFDSVLTLMKQFNFISMLSVVLFVFKVHATHTRDFIYVVCEPYKTRIYSLNHNVNSILSTVFVRFYASV